MKKLHLILLLILTIFLANCKDDINDRIVDENQSLMVMKMSEVSELLSKTTSDLIMVSNVHKGIQKSIEYGLDEELKFIEIFDKKSNKIIGNEIKDKLSKNQSLITLGVAEKSSYINDLIDFLIKEDIQIYWPYSENWDGFTNPILTFAPDDLESPENIGFKAVFDGDVFVSMDTVIVNDQYCFDNPVWIINKSGISYDDLPYFSEGEYVANGVIFVQKNNDIAETKSAVNYEDPNMVYEVQVGEIRCTYQYDAIWSGGPEFRTKWVGAKSNNTADYDPGAKYLAQLTRANVRKEEWVEFYMPVFDNWNPDITKAFYFFAEEDGEKENKKVSGKVGFKGFEISCSFEYDKRDEVIYDKSYLRESYFAQTHGVGDPNAEFQNGWRIFTSGPTQWTMPYIIRPRFY